MYTYWVQKWNKTILECEVFQKIKHTYEKQNFIISELQWT
jgi:hypothetical protein